MLDQAKSRSTPAIYRDATGRYFVFAAGSAKAGDDFSTSVPPGLARVALVAEAGKPAFLRIDRMEKTQRFENPGSPIVSSAGGEGAIVWVLDSNAPRSAPLYGDQAPKPMLYAFDAETLKLLWKSAPGVLRTSGKYNEPAVVDGMVLVGTDRLQAFTLGAGTPSRIARALRAPRTRPATVDHPASVAARPAKSAGDPVAAGQAIFQARCAGCHASRQPGTPSRADIARLSQAQITEILQHGPMRPMAAGLSPADIAHVARFLTTGP